MRSTAFGLLLLSLAGCANNEAPSLRSGAPGIEVARAAIRGGSPQIALPIVTNILAREPGNDSALIIQGEALTALGRFEEAATSFATVLQHDPASVSAHIGLGRVRLGSDPAGAEALFLEALQRQPTNSVALNNLGIARDLQGRHTDAQAAYRQAMASSPDMAAARVNLALSLAMDGQARDAIQLLRPLANDPGASSKVRHDLAAVLTMGGNRAEAETILSKDLAPLEVRQALDAYAAATTGVTVNPVAPVPAAAPKLPPVATPAAAPIQANESQIPETESRVRAADTGTSSAGNVLVQLSAAISENAAQAEWQRLQQHMPEVMGEHRASIVKVEQDGRVFWRLRTGGFADANEATAFCDRLRAGGSACVIMR